MAENADQPPEADAVADYAEQELAGLDPTPFSPAAFGLLTRRVAEHIQDLFTEALRTARRHRADTVSATHVDQASQYLVASAGRRGYRHLGTVGGILLGAALSQFLAIVTSSQYTPTGILLAAGLGVAGAFMVAFDIAKG